jgi:hypothetical protein
MAVQYSVSGHTTPGGLIPGRGPVALFADVSAGCQREEEGTAGIWPNGHVFIQGPHKFH